MIVRSEPYFWALDLNLQAVGQQIESSAPGISQFVSMSFRQPTDDECAAVIVDMTSAPVITFAQSMMIMRPAVHAIGLTDSDILIDFPNRRIVIPVELAQQSASKRTIRYVTATLAPG